MKTAMQEMIEYLENTWYVKEIKDWEDIKINIIKKEKEQIADAFRSGSTSSMLGGGHWTQYYNQTYK